MALGSQRRIDSSMPGKETNPHALSSNFVHPRATVPAEPTLSFSLSAHPVGPTTYHLRPLSYRLVFRPSPPRATLPPPSIHHSHPHHEQLSGYELTELRSFCGGRASSYAAYPLQNVSDALCLCIQAQEQSIDELRGRDIALV